MSTPRGLSPEEAALWARVAKSVTPLPGRSAPPEAEPEPAMPGAPIAADSPRSKRVKGRVPPPSAPRVPSSATPAPTGLDSHWERRLGRATFQPEFTLDLHGHTLDQAYHRLNAGLAQARAMGARLVLLITGKPRFAEAADRGQERGAIRAKILDWLAAGSHRSAIAAIRKAHRRHGGEGALYIVLKRER